MANTNLSFKKIVHKLSSPDAYQRLRSGNHDDTTPLLGPEPRGPPPSYSWEKPHQEAPSFRDEQAGEQLQGEQQWGEQQRGEKILCTADRLAVGMGLEYKKREVILKRTGSSAGTGGSAYKRAGGGGRSGRKKK